MKLFVKGIEPSINEVALEAFFSRFGKIVSTKIIYDRITWESRGFGFVEFLKKDDALKAIENLNGTELKGKILSLTEAEERKR